MGCVQSCFYYICTDFACVCLFNCCWSILDFLSFSYKIAYFLNIIDYIDSFVEYFSAPVYHLLILLLYITYIVAIIGVSYINTDYTRYLSIIIQLFIAFILMVRFNPLRKKLKCNNNDRTLVFASAFYLLFNDEFTNYVIDYFKENQILNFMKKKLEI